MAGLYKQSCHFLLELTKNVKLLLKNEQKFKLFVIIV